MLEVAGFLADRCYQDVYLAHKFSKQAALGKGNLTWNLWTEKGIHEYYDYFRKEICEITPLIRALRAPPRISFISPITTTHALPQMRTPPHPARAVMSPKLTHVNVHANTRETLKVVDSVVKLDRLPTENSLAALHLLYEAWCEYDVAMHLATHYKYIAKFLYAMHLAIGVAIVVFGVVLGENEGTQYAQPLLLICL